MFTIPHVIDATSKIVKLRAIVISTGLPYTAGVFNTATIAATYTRDAGTATTITLVTATAGTWTSSGFVHAGKGVYELGAPNAALATGADGVIFSVDGIADVLFTVARVELAGSSPRAASLTATQIADAQLDEFILWLQDGGFSRPASTGNATLKNSTGAGQTVAITTAADVQGILSAT